MICPKCKADIDDDSFYCDSCGEELMMCPKCRVAGKGKRCTRCGSVLVSAKDLANGAAGARQPNSPTVQQSVQSAATQPTTQPISSSAQPSAKQPTVKPVASPNDDQPEMATVQTAFGPMQFPVASASKGGAAQQQASAQSTMRPTSVARPTRLVCSSIGADIPLIDGGVIGRKQGNYVNVFGSQGYVSGCHAVLNLTPSGWTITDSDSTNGTFVNGVQLQPDVACGFSIGDTITIATLDFVVR